MKSIVAITILVTSHVLPNIFAISVILFVSTSMKPAPKKKQVKEKFLVFILLILFIKKNENKTNNITTEKYVTG